MPLGSFEEHIWKMFREKFHCDSTRGCEVIDKSVPAKVQKCGFFHTPFALPTELGSEVQLALPATARGYYEM